MSSHYSESRITVCPWWFKLPGYWVFDAPPLRDRVPSPGIWVDLGPWWPVGTVKVTACDSEAPALKAVQLPHPRLTGHLLSGPRKNKRSPTTLRPPHPERVLAQTTLHPAQSRQPTSEWRYPSVFHIFPAEATCIPWRQAYSNFWSM